MKNLYTIILISLFSFTFALYNVGQTISIAHQSQSSTVCNGQEPNGEDDGSLRLIDYNGDVLLCAHDWEKQFIAGNAFKENIFDIWNGKNFNFARNKLKDSNRGFKPCNKCNVDGTLIGEKYYKSF